MFLIKNINTHNIIHPHKTKLNFLKSFASGDQYSNPIFHLESFLQNIDSLTIHSGHFSKILGSSEIIIQQYILDF